MDTDASLDELIASRDHLNVLRYVRVHQLREPTLVIAHGRRLLGDALTKSAPGGDLVTLACLEQICLAALDASESELPSECLTQLNLRGVPKESVRFRHLLGRCLEAAQDYSGAEQIYDELLQENAGNLMALKRKYCIRKAQGKVVEAAEALNTYLEHNANDPAAWYEMATMRQEGGDYKAALFGLEEVLLCCPADANIHVEIAECHATIGGLEHLGLARKHACQVLELDATHRRAQFALVSIMTDYIKEAEAALSSSNKKSFPIDEHDILVAKELLKFGKDLLNRCYTKTAQESAVNAYLNK